MKDDGLPVLLSPRRHTPLAASRPAPRAVARVMDAAGWTVRKVIAFNAAI
ncbi:hypothetical protein ACKI14_02595 [Streptomyces turgidiscabies]